GHRLSGSRGMGGVPTGRPVPDVIADHGTDLQARAVQAPVPAAARQGLAPLTPTAPTPTAPSIRSRPPPPAHRRPDDRRSPIERPKASGGALAGRPRPQHLVTRNPFRTGK